MLAVDYSETLRHSLPPFVRRGLGWVFKREILDRLVYQIFCYEDLNEPDWSLLILRYRGE